VTVDFAKVLGNLPILMLYRASSVPFNEIFSGGDLGSAGFVGISVESCREDFMFWYVISINYAVVPSDLICADLSLRSD